MKPYGYLYKTTIFTGRKVLVYVGKRVKPNFVKSYFGSGKIVTKILREGSYQSKKVELVEYFYSREELNAGEKALVAKTREEWLGHCINVAPGGEGGKGTYWTYEKCKVQALQFKTRTAWQNGCPSYQAARTNGWLDECCAHMEYVQLPNGYWTLEKCQAAALKYRSRTEWQQKDAPSYQGARRQGFVDQCCAHMVLKKRANGYWTLERCKESAAQFKTRQEWADAKPKPYRVALSAKWMDECCHHMGESYMPYGYWNLENCKIEALKYETRTAWQKAGGGSYMSAHKNGWLDECCSHMAQLRVPNGFWTLETCKSDALRFSSRKAWKTASSRAFVLASENGWLDECCAHMSILRVSTWTRESCKKDAQQYKTRSEWRRASGSAMNAAYKNGWLDECCAHMDNHVRRAA